jgi:hypothetical protein
MAKKLLNEATVRRFQSLANLKPINEMAGMPKRDDEEKEEKMEEGVYEAEEDGKEKMEEAEHGDKDKENLEETYLEADEEPGDAPEAPEMPEMDGAADLDDVELTDEEAEALIALGEKLAAAMGDADEPEMEMDDAPEMPEMDAEEAPMMEEDELMETLSEIDYVPSQTEIVNEVARRVARRLAEAQKAEKRMNEALGRK